MLTQFAELYPYGLIRYTQSTFVELVTDTEVHRIDFRGKISCRLRRGTRGAVLFPAAHPLLDALHVPLTTLMAHATARYLANASALLAAIRQELTRHHAQTIWFDFERHGWTRCDNGHLAYYNIVSNLTRTGRIILQSVPVPVAHAVASICAEYGVRTYAMNHRITSPAESPFQLMLVGSNFIIAREFVVSTLC